MCKKNESIYVKLREFIIAQSAVDDEFISNTTELINDLGVNGGDAVDFIIAYGMEFCVDVTNFEASKYFEADGDLILPAIIRNVFGREKTLKKKLTVGHLLKGIIAGRLDEEIING